MEHWTIRRSGAREITLFMYPELRDLEGFMNHREKRIFFTELNDRIRGVVHMLDAMASGDHYVDKDGIGERYVSRTGAFIAYRITVEPKEKVIWKDTTQS